jgi:nucleotide-binding universal stress UspA family protein
VIIVGIDGSEASKDTLRFALQEARLRHTSLHALHAYWEWEPVPGTSELEVDRAPQEREAWLVDLVAEVVGEPGDVEITISTVADDAARALLAAARDAELLIVGSRGHGGFSGLLLGSVSQHCAHHAPCPLLIVRPSNGYSAPAIPAFLHQSPTRPS